MNSQRIVLAHESRLMREMIKHILSKSSTLEVIGEAQTMPKLNSILENKEADWLIANLSPDGAISLRIQKLLLSNPELSVLGITHRGDYVQMYQLHIHQEQYQNCSLDDMVKLLKK